MNKTGILGGTFNPPHYGHLIAARNVYRSLGLTKVLFVPTNIPPHKCLPENAATAEDRCEMVRRLIAPYEWAELCRMEVERGGPSYTVDTLRALRQQTEDALYLIIGTDMLLSFDTQWYQAEKIASLCTLAVCARKEGDEEILRQKTEYLKHTLQAKVEIVRGDVLEISSTALRQDSGMLRYTAPGVAEYIREHRLYEERIG